MEKSSRHFRLLADFEPGPAGFDLDRNEAADASAPLMAAMQQFNHDYFYSQVSMKADDHEDTLELAFDIVYAITQIPGWLSRLASGNCRSGLLFGAQGSERELIAERQGQEVVYWFRPFFSDGADSPRIRAPAAEFLNEWIRLTNKVLDKLVELHPPLPGDPEFEELRKSLNNVPAA
jgi:hypothetical protein